MILVRRSTFPAELYSSGIRIQIQKGKQDACCHRLKSVPACADAVAFSNIKNVDRGALADTSLVLCVWKSFSAGTLWSRLCKPVSHPSSPHRAEKERGAQLGHTHCWPFGVQVNILLYSPLRLFSPVAPPSPSSQWWQRRRTRGCVISWLTPGLGCVTPAAVRRGCSLIRWVVLRGSVVERQSLPPPPSRSQPSHISQSGRGGGTVTGAQLPSPNRVTDTCLGRAQTYTCLSTSADTNWATKHITCHHSSKGGGKGWRQEGNPTHVGVRIAVGGEGGAVLAFGQVPCTPQVGRIQLHSTWDAEPEERIQREAWGASLWCTFSRK